MTERDPVSVLTRWESAGAVWKVLARSPGAVTVGLYSCDAGEEMERFTSSDADLLALVEAREGEEG